MTLSVALAQFNPIVGDLAGNSMKIRQAATHAAHEGAHLVLCGEMSLTGYPVEDLALRTDFQQASRAAITELARDIAADGHGDLTVIVGFLDSTSDAPATTSHLRGEPRNAAAVIHDGVVTARYFKHFLPNYGVFDEARYFVPGTEPLIIDVHGHTVCLAICEDLWRPGGPVEWARRGKAEFLAVLNASPYEMNKDDTRLALCRERAAESGAIILYTNIVGGQDELVFDGGSMIVNPSGEVLARAEQFNDSTTLAHLDPDTNAQAGSIAPPLDELAEVWAALVLSLRDYVTKNGFRSVLFGASGGIDSAVVGALAADALGPDRVFAVALPSPYSSEHSVADAYELAERTGLSIRTIPIKPIFDAYMSSLELTGLAEENLQARIRGTTLMGLSNAEGHLVLATGNKSELSVGYSTIYGDAVGGFAPIKDIPKSLVWELARWRNHQAEQHGETPPIPPASISKEPSAELRPDQLDTDTLPDYQTLDAILEAYVHHDNSADYVISLGFDPDLVRRIIRLTDLAEYKRRQYPPGTKITLKSFGRDRRLPITNQWRG
ncbi:MAG: NAD+ synthase [Candidatus Nanopelagicales bacterium]|nr:NAD+ synthase [Candidatus Nanopelagicales bacterium]